MRRSPQIAGRYSPLILSLAACAAISGWLVVASITGAGSHPRYLEMLSAARSVQSAMQVVRSAKAELALLPPRDLDPNATGLIGPEWTEIVTTLGSLGSKRTATNPDLAALFVRWYDMAGVRPGDTVVLVLSGSFPAGNIAAIAAAESLGIRPLIVGSVGASMFGATDPELTWLDLHLRLVESGVLRTPPALAVIGGIDGNGQGMDSRGVEAVRVAARRTGTRLLEAPTLADLVSQVEANIDALTSGPTQLIVIVGGPAVGTGSCLELVGITDGWAHGEVTCAGGTQGLLSALTAKGAYAIHLLNLRFMALAWGLPYDPVPLPTPGDNRRIYGAR